MPTNLGIVLPCYNEEDVIDTSLQQLHQFLNELVKKRSIDDFILFCIDDGSKDNTWNIIKEKALQNNHFRGIKLSHNAGHQNALIAGIEEAINFCDAIITIDVDLQDDISAIAQMVEKFNNGTEIVYGVRDNRESDSLLKRGTAQLFYHLMHSFKAGTIPNHADFRLMSKRACEALLDFPERNIFLRGIVPSIGFKSEMVFYRRIPRKQGKSKYPLTKMCNFAIEGITSFSIRPIRMIFAVGIIFLLCTVSVAIYVAIAIMMGRSYPGWASLMLSLWLIGSLVLIALGIIGEYIGKIYLEVKKRPRYFIEEKTQHN